MDLSSLSKLKEALESAQKNTHRMIQKLDGFESRLRDLDQNMRPIEEETHRYTTAKDNISKTLTEVGKTYEYFRVANEVKDCIAGGISVNQKAYFDAMIKLSNAKEFFQSHREIKSSSSVLTSIDLLLCEAQKVCLAEFEKLINTTENSVTFNDGQYQMVNPLPTAVVKDIRLLCDAFEASKYTDYFKYYQIARIAKLKSELKEYEKANSVIWHSLCYTEDPYQKGTNHFFSGYFLLSYWLLRSEFSFMGNILPLNEDSLRCFVNICDAILSEIRTLLTPLLAWDPSQNSQSSGAIANVEKSRSNNTSVNPVIRQSKLLLIRLDLFDILNGKYDEYRDVCHPDARHESSASIALNQLRQKITEAIVKSLEYLLSSSISDAFQDRSTSRNLGDMTDCDLHPATHNLLYACKELVPNYVLLYKKVYDLAMLYSQQEIAVRMSVSVPNDMESIVCSVLENLMVALEARANLFEDGSSKATRRSLLIQKSGLFRSEDKSADEFILIARKNLFLINNVFAIQHLLKEKFKEGDYITNNSLPAGNSSSSAAANKRKAAVAVGNVSQRMNNLHVKITNRLALEQSAFCEKIALGFGLHAQDLQSFLSAYETQKSQQSRLLKAKFNVFNTGLEALLSQQGEWRISSTALRDLLTLQLIQNLVPAYTSFFNTYSTVKFSKKHMNEYLKYTPAKLEMHVQGFFGRVNIVTKSNNLSGIANAGQESSITYI